MKTAFNGHVFITYIDHGITYDRLKDEVREICSFKAQAPFTIKGAKIFGPRDKLRLWAARFIHGNKIVGQLPN